MDKTIAKCSEIITNGDVFDGYVKTIDKYECQLEQYKESKSSLHQLCLILSWLSNAYLNKGVADYLTTGTFDRNEVIKSWLYTLRKIYIREVMLYNLASECSDFESFADDINYEMTSDFLAECWSLTGLFLTTQGLQGDRVLKLLRIIEVRGDIDLVRDDSPSFNFQFMLMKFLIEEYSAQNLISLSKVPPFELLKNSDLSGSSMKTFISEIITWHLNECTLSLRKDNYQYPIQPYSVLPVWIYALFLKINGNESNILEFGDNILFKNLRSFFSLLGKVDIKKEYEILEAMTPIEDIDVDVMLQFWEPFCKEQ